MTRTIQHSITACSICPHTGGPCRPGFDIAQRLCQTITAGGAMIGEDFEISGHVDMVGCPRPCTGAFHATKSTCRMFGDVQAGADIPALLALPDPVAAITLDSGAALS